MAEDLMKVARENIEAFNSGDWTRYEKTLAPDSLYEEYGTQRKIQGPAKIVQANRDWKMAFPDAKGTIANSYGSGTTVVLELTWEGTQSGPLQGPGGSIPPTGKRAKLPAIMVLAFDGGKIKRSHHYFDFMTLLQQIGAETKVSPATR